MNPETGQIQQMTEDEALAKKPPWVPITDDDVARVTAMPTEDRIKWARNKLKKRRAANKAARKARKAARRRR